MSDITLWSLFTGSFLASTLLPGGSEALLLLIASNGEQGLILLWSIATAGNTLGGLSSWFLGWLIRKQLGTRTLDKPRQKRAIIHIERYGGPVLLLSWLPVVGDPLCLAAGWAGIHPIPAAIYIGIGKGLRYAMLLALL